MAFKQLTKLPIRKTGRGIWVPTPVRVIEEAIETLKKIGLLGEGTPPLEQNETEQTGTILPRRARSR